MTTTNRMNLVLGDWSNDGHGKFDKILVEVNHTVEEVRAAYLKSVETTGLDFAEKVASEYESHMVIDSNVAETLEKHGIKCDDIALESPEGDSLNDIDKYEDGDTKFTRLFFDFVKLSLPDLTYKEITDIPNINGFWGPLNISLGYGLYD